MKILILIIFNCIYFSASSQTNLQYQNINNLTFPSKIDTIETKGTKIFYASTPDFYFACIADTSSRKRTYDQSRFYRSLQLIIEGYFSTENWKYFQREQVDTIIGNIEGRLIHGYGSGKPSPVNEFFDFFTIVEGRAYYVLACSLKELTPPVKKEIDSFLGSLIFEGKNYDK